MSESAIDFFSSYIEKETGIIFAGDNRYQLKTRLEEICKSEKLSTLDELAAIFKQTYVPAIIKQKLLDIATNNETLFFRDPSFFSAIESFLMRDVIMDIPSEIRIWSAAASTGQEALSVAMAMEELAKKVSIPPYSIVATDISERALNRARNGLYSDFEIRRGLSEERRDRFFMKKDNEWMVRPQIHNKIKFGYNNLIRSNVNGPFHLILCRNVLIYHKIEIKKLIVDSLYKELDPTGGILLGCAETLLGIKENVATNMVGNVIFYQKKKL